MQGARAMNILRRTGALSLAMMGLLFACDRANNDNSTNGPPDKPGVANTQPTTPMPPAATPTQAADQPVTAGAAGPNVDATTVDQLAAQRCALETTCQRVGLGQTYSTRDECLTQMHASIRSDLASYDCASGFDRSQVQQCMAAIQRFDCGHAFATIQTVAACRANVLCAK
jgi:hypothetical protein